MNIPTQTVVFDDPAITTTTHIKGRITLTDEQSKLIREALSEGKKVTITITD